MSYVLANIGKIQCDDEEFKGFQQAIKNCIFVFDAETKKFKVKYDDELDLDIGDDNSIIETTEE